MNTFNFFKNLFQNELQVNKHQRKRQTWPNEMTKIIQVLKTENSKELKILKRSHCEMNTKLESPVIQLEHWDESPSRIKIK